MLHIVTMHSDFLEHIHTLLHTTRDVRELFAFTGKNTNIT